MALFAALSAGPKTKRERYELQRADLWSERQGGGFDAHWRDLSDVFFPRRSRFVTTERNRGDRRYDKIIDSTGLYSARTLQSGLHAGLTSPARPWFKLGTPDPELQEFEPVKVWLHLVEQRMRAIFTQTNLYKALPIVYGDIGVFGTGAMSVLDDTRRFFRATAYPLGSFALGLDGEGRVSTFVHEYELSVRQVVEQFALVRGTNDLRWENISTRVKDLWDRGNYTAPVTIVWIVTPNDDYRPGNPFARFARFVSVHYELDTREHGRGQGREILLRESGYHTFPIMAPRWAITHNDAYGTDCPGMTALGDNRQLQIMERKKGQLISKAIDPPLKGSPELRTQKTSLLPGHITYVNFREGTPGLEPVHEVRLEGYQHLVNDEELVRFRIRRAFFEDLFLMLAASDPARGAQPITAREVEERHEEKLLALGPVLEQTHEELLSPLIDRVYAMMDDAGLLPDPPPDLEGVALKVEFTSILAQAQKLVSVVGLDRFISSTLPLMEAAPVVQHKIDFDQIVENYGDALGIDPRIVRSTEDAQARAQQAADVERGILAAQQAKDVAAAMGTAGKAPIAPDSALDRLLSAAGGR